MKVMGKKWERREKKHTQTHSQLFGESLRDHFKIFLNQHLIKASGESKLLLTSIKATATSYPLQCPLHFRCRHPLADTKCFAPRWVTRPLFLLSDCETITVGKWIWSHWLHFCTSVKFEKSQAMNDELYSIFCLSISTLCNIFISCLPNLTWIF